MKKTLALLLCLLTCGLFSSCGAAGEAERGTPTDSRTEKAPVRVVASIFPLYDWTRQILGGRAEDVELTLLLDRGVDLHSFQPSVEDLAAVTTCGLLIYVGGPSDDWVTDALAASPNPDRKVLNLLEILGERAKEEETVEGMQEERGEEEDEYDEHVWLSLKNAQILCGAIADALSTLDPENAAAYAENLNAYTARLSALDAAYEDAVRESPVKTLLFGDRFPFRYLADDYGLNYYAAFPGCSAETEASFETVAFLSGKVDELGLPAVLTIDGGDGKIAETIVENSAAKSARILRMDSLQSTTAQEIENGASYLAAMEDNLSVLRQALQ